MIDTTALIGVLNDYDAALLRSREAIQAAFEQLEQSWTMFATVYSGQAAEQFADMFNASVLKMRECNEAMDAIQKALQVRIEVLTRLDTAGAGI
ncbi:hypothetical protein CFR73_09700 [Novacetimonas maltaceti]|uniref:ESAT-6-like protein n=1 Tax=Novacetimonas maltaceti TaxID=1203393 RepID=A0A2S3W3Z2_9PROT|nr:WXG100 family type VII secretion target [Novacetimonas maltaceti]POF63580.1 hypothetical protein KMAL_07600 [Novacetimonas maltaceti]PYD59851.1 hypothetical protein CFR73_09700 [Novacetimonas maltaceti]